MFETLEFRNGIEERVQVAVDQFGLIGFEPRVVDTMQQWAVDNELDLKLLEDQRPPDQRRGVVEALQSASQLSNAAAAFAVARQSAELQVRDLTQAHQAQFCRVWPFCR
jgi:hypothetical protein